MNATVTPAEESSDLRLVLPGRSTPAGSGWDWLKGGWDLFVRAPLMWIISQILATLMARCLSIALGGLTALALLLPLMAAYWFAPVLVVMHDLPPLEAMKASFFACFANFIPFLVYSILMIPLFILAAIPFGL